MPRIKEKTKAERLSSLLNNFIMVKPEIQGRMGWDKWALIRRRKGKGWTKEEEIKFLKAVEYRLDCLKFQVGKMIEEM